MPDFAISTVDIPKSQAQSLVDQAVDVTHLPIDKHRQAVLMPTAVSYTYNQVPSKSKIFSLHSLMINNNATTVFLLENLELPYHYGA